MKKTIKAFVGTDADEFFNHHRDPEWSDLCYTECYTVLYNELCKRKGGPVDVETLQRTDPDFVAAAEATGRKVMEVEPDREFMIYDDRYEGDLIIYKDEIEWLKF